MSQLIYSKMRSKRPPDLKSQVTDLQEEFISYEKSPSNITGKGDPAFLCSLLTGAQVAHENTDNVLIFPRAE